jgi:hypothetical protein
VPSLNVATRPGFAGGDDVDDVPADDVGGDDAGPDDDSGDGDPDPQASTPIISITAAARATSIFMLSSFLNAYVFEAGPVL